MRRVAWLAVLLAVVGQGTAAGDPGGEIAPTTDEPVAGLGAVGADITNRYVWSPAGAHRGDEVVLAVVVEVPPTMHINPSKQYMSDPYLIPTELKVVSASVGLKPAGVRYPPPVQVEVGFTGHPQLVVAYEGRVAFHVPVQVGVNAALGPATVDLALTYQACNATQCWPPVTVPISAAIDVIDDGKPVGPATEPEIFTDFSTDHTDDGGVRFDFFNWSFELSPGAWLGWLGLHVVAGLGGFMLNLTPCVLPVIPLKILSLSQLSGNRRRCLLLGAVMSLGIVAFWLALAGVIAGVSGFTTTNQLFQYPWFTIGVGLIIAWMAVGMCGLFSVGLPRFVYQFNPSPESVPGSFGLGVMTAVLSTPCTAPLMGSAAAWATTQAWTTVLTTFGAIGVGMALPYLVLSTWPGLVSRVPRSGPGSVLVKQLMGLMMLAGASYFIGVGLTGWLSQPGQPPSLMYWWVVLAWVAAGGVWLAVSAWRIWRSGTARGVFVSVAVVVVAMCAWAGVKLTDRGELAWAYYTPQRWDEARAQGKAVVLDFTAEWCLNCKFLEGTVLNSRDVVEALSRDGVVAMKVDLTGWDEAGRAKLKEAGRVTIPLLVVYGRDGREVFKGDAYTTGQVVDAVARALE